jgi:hypothetical protein
MSSAVEKELIKVTKVKADRFEDRQDFLAALLKAMDKLTDDEFDNLSDEAAEWHTKKAVPAMNKKKPIPDFVEAEAEADEAPADDDAETGETEVEEAADGDIEGTEETAEDDAEAESDNEAAEAAAEKAAKAKKGNGKKPAKAAKAKPAAKEPDADAEEKPAKAKPKERKYSELTGARDRFGVILGTKTSDAVAMYVKGATSAQIVEELGGRHYNILTKLAKEGHKVENVEGVWTLTHKDDLAAKPKKKAK